MGLNWFTTEWKLLAEEFLDCRKKWTLKVKNRGKDISDSNSKKAKKIVYGQTALSLEFWSCK